MTAPSKLLARVPELLIGAAREFDDPLDQGDRGIQIWRDADGTVCARGRSESGRHRMDIPRVASFRFEDGKRDEVLAIPEASAGLATVNDAYVRMVLPMVLHTLGTQVLHGSGVLTADGVLGFCGRSGTGKSTIACAMREWGYPAWADDAVAYDVSDDSISSVPMPFRMRLPAPSAAFLRRAPAPSTVPRGLPDAPPNGTEPAPLLAVCVLSRAHEKTRRGPADLRRVPPAEAFRALLPHAYCFDPRDQDRMRALVHGYLGLSLRVPVFELRFTPNLEALPAMLERIQSTILPP